MRRPGVPRDHRAGTVKHGGQRAQIRAATEIDADVAATMQRNGVAHVSTLAVIESWLTFGRTTTIARFADDEGRTALHGAAHKGRNEVVQMLVDHGAKLDAHDMGSRDTVNGAMLGYTWIPLHYAQGLVRVGVQSAKAHPETAELIKSLMIKQGLPIPPDITSSICLTKGVNGCQ